MQIRPVSTFSAPAVSPHTMRLCSCSACIAITARLASPTAPSSAPTTDEPGVQRNKDGDTFSPAAGRELSKEDKAKVRELQARDAEVRAHENAHKAAAGGLARGGPNYEYTTGPDGKRYAVGGDVQIDASPGRTPEETIAKAQRIRAAGLAPSQPSGQDRAVVSEASAMEARARAQAAKQGESDPDGGADSPEDRPRLDLTV